MEKRIPNTDTTYCINRTCEDKCWRHESNYDFNINKLYWFTDACIKTFGEGGNENE